MVRDTWHIMSGSRGVTCHVQNESNMSLSGTHERHMALCYWKEIHGRWIRDMGVIQITNEKWTSDMRGQVFLTQLVPIDWMGEKREKIEREKKEERERITSREIDYTFSLDFSVIGPSTSGETRGKVDPHCKSYAWVPVLWSSDNSGR